MLPGGVLLVLLLVAATARGDSSHDFDWFRTFARDGLTWDALQQQTEWLT